MRFKTRLIHNGHEPDKETGAIMPPIYMTSTFIQEEPGKTKGYDYTRAGNPNFTQLERLLAATEEAEFATIFSSGLGAITALLSTLTSGDHVVIAEGVYGGTYRLFTQVFQNFGIHPHFAKADQIEKALQIKPKFLFFETPTNPLLEIVDIERMAKLGKTYGTLTIVDNTLATPYFQNPLRWGADIVVHSTTKYIGGHSDVIGGVVMTNNQSVKEKMDFARMALGINPSPFDAWLIMRGLKTLALRMEAHEENARKIAEFLSSHPLVKKVYYPGLSNHRGHSIAKKQMTGFSGIVSVELELSVEEIKERLAKLQLIALGESLGGVESLVCVPALMTHASIPKERREVLGITPNLLRLSLGIEDKNDLIADLESALE